ncbi:hypothetical protein PPERSA_12121 [Pseudocohnilembus persalinus]|uniref:Uncharacterized protein n=1 Tax=Pseudocohnilembus persalinus TaxID=266149 RepID=A0A0V0QP18_PSEPJ|nr:hypothetical protein PPERSA_12121 [Pseudocohnilembus persalinus]|eukprot:KRX03916.1 hypothetical protein PPERSA_12121 [Pseudocohnilembus persalinus]
MEKQQDEQQKEIICSFKKNESDQIYIAYYKYQSQLLKQAEQNDIGCVFQGDQIILKSQKINKEKIKKFLGKFLDQINIVQLKFDSLNQKKAFFDCKKIKEKMKEDQLERVQVQNRLYLIKFQEQDLKKEVVKIQDFGQQYLKFIQNNYYKKFYFLTESFISPKQIQDKTGNNLNNIKCQLVKFFIDKEKDEIKKILKAYPEVMVETLYYKYTKSNRQQFQFRNCYIFTKENIYDKQLQKDNINRKAIQFDTINQIDQLSKQILNNLLEKYLIVGIKMIRDQGQKQSPDEIKAKTQQVKELLIKNKQQDQTVFQQFDYKKGFLILVFRLEFFKEENKEIENNNLSALQISNIDGQNQCHTLNITFDQNQDENDIGQTEEVEKEEELQKIELKQQILLNKPKIQNDVEKSINQDNSLNQSQSDIDASQNIDDSILNQSSQILEEEENPLDQSYL